MWAVDQKPDNHLIWPNNQLYMWDRNKNNYNVQLLNLENHNSERLHM